MSSPLPSEVIDYAYAALTGDNEAIAAFLDDYPAAVDIKDKYGLTALMTAAQAGRENSLKLLLERNAAVDEKSLPQAPGDIHDWTALMYAAHAGNKKIVALLLEKGADAEAKDDAGYAAADYAGAEGHEAIVALLKEWSEKQKRQAEEQKNRIAAKKHAQFLVDTDFSGGLKKPIPRPRLFKILPRQPK